jgi:hypothetical protein
MTGCARLAGLHRKGGHCGGLLTAHADQRSGGNGGKKICAHDGLLMACDLFEVILNRAQANDFLQ